MYRNILYHQSVTKLTYSVAMAGIIDDLFFVFFFKNAGFTARPEICAEKMRTAQSDPCRTYLLYFQPRRMKSISSALLRIYPYDVPTEKIGNPRIFLWIGNLV